MTLRRPRRVRILLMSWTRVQDLDRGRRHAGDDFNVVMRTVRATRLTGRVQKLRVMGTAKTCFLFAVFFFIYNNEYVRFIQYVWVRFYNVTGQILLLAYLKYYAACETYKMHCSYTVLISSNQNYGYELKIKNVMLKSLGIF